MSRVTAAALMLPLHLMLALFTDIVALLFLFPSHRTKNYCIVLPSTSEITLKKK